MSIDKEIIELSLSTESSFLGICEILKSLLVSHGIKPQEIVEYKEDSRLGVSVFFRSARKARELKGQLGGLKLKDIAVRLTKLKKIDWQEKWKRDFQPFALTPGIDVVPVWHKNRYQPSLGRQMILIDTATAFGTGLHDTTRFMAQFIENHAGRFESFLDVGTGTGILSLVALKSKAQEVWAIDIDTECIAVAQSNMTLNGYVFDYLKAMDVFNFSVQRQFDYVAANLISHDLVRLKRKIVSFVKARKFLAISGISPENLPLVKKHFKQLPLRCRKIEKSKNWVALLYQRV